jgi:hypothetical protein
LSVVGQTILLGRQRDAKSAQLDRAIQNVIGRVSMSYLASLKASPSRLKGTIEKKVEESQAQVKGGSRAGGASTLSFLQDLSKGVPASVVTEIKQLDYKPSSLSMTMESPSQAAAERAVSTLTSLPIFQNPKAGPLENAKNGRKKFTLNATLKGQ